MSKKIKINRDDVSRVARLARLKLSDEELRQATDDLHRVLEHFAAIQAIDTAGVPEAADASGLKNVVRPDVSETSVLADEKGLIDTAPRSNNGHVQVPAVFE